MVGVKIDTTRFDRDFKQYMTLTSKTLVEAVNYKLFYCSRQAVKDTPKAVRSEVLQSLNATSKKYPNRTVAEMIVIAKSRLTGEAIEDLNQVTKTFKNKRIQSIAWTKAGWLPALRKLIKYVGKESISISGVGNTVRMFLGGATPAALVGSTIMGSVYNDVEGTGNKAFVTSIKEQGAQAGIDKVSMDMETYISKKLKIPIDQFNHS
jgi:hypothetical protein